MIKKFWGTTERRSYANQCGKSHIPCSYRPTLHQTETLDLRRLVDSHPLIDG